MSQGGGTGSGTSGKGGASTPSAYDQSANYFNQAGSLLGQAQEQYMQANPGAAQGYNPALSRAFGYDGAQTKGSGYGASLMNAASTADPSLIAKGMGNYMNPYTQNVVNRSIMDVNRLTNQQDAQTAAGAANVGAFGGSRQGVVEALTRSEAQKNIGDLSGTLRQQGFDTAANLSAQDVQNAMATGQFNAGLQQQGRLSNQAAENQSRQFTAGNAMTANLANQAATNQSRQFLAGNQQAANFANQGSRNNARQFQAQSQNQRDIDNANFAMQRGQGLSGLMGGAQGLGQGMFDIAQQINSDQMGAGQLQQQLMQQILGNTQGQYDQYMNAPQNLLNMQLQALGMNPLNNTGTTTQQNYPGLMGWASLLGQTATGMWGVGG